MWQPKMDEDELWKILSPKSQLPQVIIKLINAKSGFSNPRYWNINLSGLITRKPRITLIDRLIRPIQGWGLVCARAEWFYGRQENGLWETFNFIKKR